jgi:hypothetical protein
MEYAAHLQSPRTSTYDAYMEATARSLKLALVKAEK